MSDAMVCDILYSMKRIVMKHPIFLLAGLLSVGLVFPAMAQDIEVSANEPTSVQLNASGPTELLYLSSQDDVINIIVRSLEEPGVVDPTVELVDADGRRLAFNDDHAGSREDLTRFDSAIEGIEIDGPAEYVIRVTSYTGAAEGSLEVTVESGAEPSEVEPVEEPDEPDEPVQDPVQQNSGGDFEAQTISDNIPEGGDFEYEFDAAAGQVVTITVRSLDNSLDPRVRLLNSSGDELAKNDDHDDDDDSLESYDSRILGFEIPDDDTYSLVITGFAGTGGDFELTIEGGDEPSEVEPIDNNGNNNSNPDEDEPQVLEFSASGDDPYLHEFEAEAGDVYTFTLVATDGSDARMFIDDSDENNVVANDDHGTGSEDIGFTDSLIQNFIFQYDDTYTIYVDEATGEGGDFELTIQKVASGAPLGEGEYDIQVDSLRPQGEYLYEFEAEEGDYITLTVRSLTEQLDPQVALLNEDGDILAFSDDHGGIVNTAMGRLDGQVTNYLIEESGTYTAQVLGYQNSNGPFVLVVNTLR
jgi:hypothetical protein